MSNFIHKVKDAITHDHHDEPSRSSNAGPHDSKLANKLDPRVDSDRDNRAARTDTSTGGTSGVSSSPYDNTTTTTTTGYAGGSGTTKPGRTSNQADSRIDSNRTQYGTAPGVGSGSGYGNNPQSTNAGPHSSNLANKADPRIDSTQSQYAPASGVSSGVAFADPRSTNAGPHGSTLGNVADPRVDSNRGQYGTTNDFASGGSDYKMNNTQSTNVGPHGSNIANKLDPRVDSDLDNRARHQNLGSGLAPAGSSYTTPGSGNAQYTAGPHNSNLTNKLDPRVDSDLDNSRTVGRDATRY
ncbi:hypothetical protein BGW36DRAFT_82343 [Talaromyces proteolyticus]|uniref:Cell surface protein n=1 Tax=Talaromyces proteolyticus TaxID=1131652 RepID=A0AAD4KZN3_9EURO|nr:uncharacterized protein BGW36DRAFT_82343 [Talaromyces proteolyticus]KAH8703066.1 hypothetical protein BGW36DRAFT_82343 [Talaromyces proteolyticus]